MKTFNYIFCGLFVLFAVLQYNDPDPYIWVPIYIYSAGLCYFAAKGNFYRKGSIIGITVYLIYAIYLFFDKTGVIDWLTEHDAENIVQSMKATKPWIEETREFGGLVILIIVQLTNLSYFRRRNTIN